jgi:hypothetical protein
MLAFYLVVPGSPKVTHKTGDDDQAAFMDEWKTPQGELDEEETDKDANEGPERHGNVAYPPHLLRLPVTQEVRHGIRHETPSWSWYDPVKVFVDVKVPCRRTAPSFLSCQ